MIEKHKRKRFSLTPNETPPWLQHARAYKREPSAGGSDVITGYAEFNGLRGTEDKALELAVKQISPDTRVHDHHQRVYKFVVLPKGEATKVERLLRTWRYSPENQVDLLRRSLDLDGKKVLPHRTSRRTVKIR